MNIKNIFNSQSHAQVAPLIGGLIVGIVMLFMGVFISATVYNATAFGNENILNTITNTTELNVSQGFHRQHNFTIGSVISGTTTRLTLYLKNASTGLTAAGTVTVSWNNGYLQNITMTANNTLTTIINNTAVLILRANSVNNVSYIIDSDSYVNVTNATLVYATDTERSDMGAIQDDIVNQTGTIMTVLGLVIIIVALVAALASLRGIGEGR